MCASEMVCNLSGSSSRFGCIALDNPVVRQNRRPAGFAEESSCALWRSAMETDYSWEWHDLVVLRGGPLEGTRRRRILLKSEVRPILMVVDDEVAQERARMMLIEHPNMVQHLSAHRLKSTAPQPRSAMDCGTRCSSARAGTTSRS